MRTHHALVFDDRLGILPPVLDPWVPLLLLPFWSKAFVFCNLCHKTNSMYKDVGH